MRIIFLILLTVYCTGIAAADCLSSLNATSVSISPYNFILYISNNYIFSIGASAPFCNLKKEAIFDYDGDFDSSDKKYLNYHFMLRYKLSFQNQTGNQVFSTVHAGSYFCSVINQNQKLIIWNHAQLLHLENVLQVTESKNQSILLLRNGSLMHWIHNSSNLEIQFKPIHLNLRFSQITANRFRDTIIGLSENGTLYEWNENFPPVSISIPDKIKHVSISKDHVIAVSSMSIYGWGSNKNHQLSMELPTINYTTPVRLPLPISEITEVYAANSFSVYKLNSNWLYISGFFNDKETENMILFDQAFSYTANDFLIICYKFNTLSNSFITMGYKTLYEIQKTPLFEITCVCMFAVLTLMQACFLIVSCYCMRKSCTFKKFCSLDQLFLIYVFQQFIVIFEELVINILFVTLLYKNYPITLSLAIQIRLIAPTESVTVVLILLIASSIIGYSNSQGAICSKKISIALVILNACALLGLSSIALAQIFVIIFPHRYDAYFAPYEVALLMGSFGQVGFLIVTKWEQQVKAERDKKITDEVTLRLLYEKNDTSKDYGSIKLDNTIQEIKFEELSEFEEIGSGASGIVLKAKWKHTVVAAKLYRRQLFDDENAITLFQNEG